VVVKDVQGAIIKAEDVSGGCFAFKAEWKEEAIAIT